MGYGVKLDAMRKPWSKWKVLAYKKLGGICQCCEEYRREFLTIDHIHGDGKFDRSSSEARFKKIVKSRGIKSRLQVLCMNCNWAKRNGDPCPHQREGFRAINYDKMQRKTKKEFNRFALEQARNAPLPEAPEGYEYVPHVATLRFTDQPGALAPSATGEASEQFTAQGKLPKTEAD